MELGDKLINKHIAKSVTIVGKEQVYKDIGHTSILTVYTLSDGERWCEDELIQHHNVLSKKNSVDHAAFIKRVKRSISSMKFDQNHHGKEPRYNLGFWNGLEFAESLIEERDPVFQDKVVESEPEFKCDSVQIGIKDTKPGIPIDINYGPFVPLSEIIKAVKMIRDTHIEEAMKGNRVAAAMFNGVEDVLAGYERREPQHMVTTPSYNEKDIVNHLRQVQKSYEEAAGTNVVCAAKYNVLEDFLADYDGRIAVHLYSRPVATPSNTVTLRREIRAVRDTRYGRNDATATDKATYNGIELVLSYLEERVPAYRVVPKVIEIDKLAKRIQENKSIQDYVVKPSLYNVGFWNGLETIEACLDGDRAPSYKSLMDVLKNDENAQLVKKALEWINKAKESIAEFEKTRPYYYTGYWNGLDYAQSILEKRCNYEKKTPQENWTERYVVAMPKEISFVKGGGVSVYCETKPYCFYPRKMGLGESQRMSEEIRKAVKEMNDYMASKKPGKAERNSSGWTEETESFPAPVVKDEKKPQRKSKTKVDTKNKDYRWIYFFATPEIADSCKEFGKLDKLNYRNDYYWLNVDGRYDFDEIVKFIENA